MAKTVLAILFCVSLFAQPKVWVGPMTVNTLTDDGVNRDYVAAITNRANWSYVDANSSVFSVWMGALGNCLYRETYGPLPFDCDTSLLRPLATALRDKQIELSSPSLVMGLYPESCSLTIPGHDGVGPVTAERWILPTLRRWAAAGGRVDYYTVDNGIGHALENLVTGPFGAGPACPGVAFTLDQLSREQALSLAAIKAEFPHVQFGFTDGLNAYPVTGLDGTAYPGDTSIPGRPSLSDLLRSQINAARAAGAPLSYFLLDSAQQPAQWSHTYSAPSGGAYWDYGRGLAAERLARSLGVLVGVYVTEPPGQFSNYNDLFTNYLQNETAYLQNYLTQDARVGQVPDFLSFVYWYGNVPNKVGSQDAWGSEFYLDARLIDGYRAFFNQSAPVAKPPVTVPLYGTTLTPAAIQGGTPVPLALTIRDSAGPNDIGVVNILINRGLVAAGGCYLAYSRPLNVLYLVADNGVSLIVVPAHGSAANSQCVVSGFSTTISENLTLNTIIAYLRDGKSTIWTAAGNATSNSGWIVSGTWGN